MFEGPFSFVEKMPRVVIGPLELFVGVDALVLVLAREVIQLAQLLVLNVINGGAHERAGCSQMHLNAQLPHLVAIQ